MSADLALGLLALLLLVFPGWRVARAYGLPLSGLAGFISGTVGFLLLILVLDAPCFGFAPRIIIPAWLAVCLLSLLVRRRPALLPQQHFPGWGRISWWLLLIIPALAVVCYRAAVQPLFGVDTVFRWNFLAEQMLARGTLAFYPPVSAADYTIYGWPDGIAPVVSALYFWGYTLAGAARPALTAPVVISQFLLLLALVHAWTRQLATPRAAMLACVLLTGSPIVLWSTAMGQESALLAIALLAMLFYLPVSRASEFAPATLFAGLSAALGGLAREYGPAIFFFGLVLCLVRRLSVRSIGLFLLSGAGSMLPWYARNWLHTGNPVFNLDVAGLFPVNLAHLRLMEVYHHTFGWSQLPPEAARIFATNSLTAIAGLAAGLFVRHPLANQLRVALLLVVTLWAISIGYSASGFTYALRVLTPGLGIAAVLGGVAIDRWRLPHLAGYGLAVSLFILSGDAALRALLLPSNVYRIPPSSWLAVSGGLYEFQQLPVNRQLAELTAGRRILVPGPTGPLNHDGASTVPIWSPEVSYLWDDAIAPAEAARRLIQSNIHFVLLTNGEVNRKYLVQMAYFRRHAANGLQPVWSDSDMILFRVTAPSQPAGTPPSP